LTSSQPNEQDHKLELSDFKILFWNKGNDHLVHYLISLSFSPSLLLPFFPLEREKREKKQKEKEKGKEKKRKRKKERMMMLRASEVKCKQQTSTTKEKEKKKKSHRHPSKTTAMMTKQNHKK